MGGPRQNGDTVRYYLTMLWKGQASRVNARRSPLTGLAGSSVAILARRVTIAGYAR